MKSPWEIEFEKLLPTLLRMSGRKSFSKTGAFERMLREAFRQGWQRSREVGEDWR